MDISFAITTLQPNCKFTCNGNDINQVVFYSDNPPSKEEILAKAQELENEAPMRALREKRDRLLAETDWWVLPDVNVTPAQLTYRQALRDLPETAAALADPSTVVFPARPTYGGTR